MDTSPLAPPDTLVPVPRTRAPTLYGRLSARPPGNRFAGDFHNARTVPGSGSASATTEPIPRGEGTIQRQQSPQPNQTPIILAVPTHVVALAGTPLPVGASTNESNAGPTSSEGPRSPRRSASPAMSSSKPPTNGSERPPLLTPEGSMSPFTADSRKDVAPRTHRAALTQQRLRGHRGTPRRGADCSASPWSSRHARLCSACRGCRLACRF